MDEYRPLEEHYRTYTYYLKKRYGGRVLRISLDGGFSCPNRDGTLGDRGCIFCSNKSFSPISVRAAGSITQQIDRVLEKLKKPEKYAGFIAYFQAYTNTYAPTEELDKIYSEAVAHTGCLGVAIGTRPDSISDSTIELLKTINKKVDVTVELGLQSPYDASLRYIKRGHNFATFKEMLYKLKAAELTVTAHLILGIPIETKEMMLKTAKIVSDLPIDILKIHHLEVVRDTELAELYQKKPFNVWDMDEYCEFITDYIQYLRQDMIIQRLYSRTVYGEIIAPIWNKQFLGEKILAALQRKKIVQGTLYNR